MVPLLEGWLIIIFVLAPLVVNKNSGEKAKPGLKRISTSPPTWKPVRTSALTYCPVPEILEKFTPAFRPKRKPSPPSFADTDEQEIINRENAVIKMICFVRIALSL